MTETDRNANTSSHGTKKKNRALTTGKKGTAEPAVVSVESLTVQPQPQQSSQGNGSATPSPPGLNDDESNPQQGAPQQHQEQEPRPSSSPSHIETSTSTQPIAAGPSTPTTTTTTTTTKIPPTIKDYRKIFVGGLPSDGTCNYYVVVLDVQPLIVFGHGTHHILFSRLLCFFFFGLSYIDNK